MYTSKRERLVVGFQAWEWKEFRKRRCRFIQVGGEMKFVLSSHLDFPTESRQMDRKYSRESSDEDVVKCNRRTSRDNDRQDRDKRHQDKNLHREVERGKSKWRFVIRIK